MTITIDLDSLGLASEEVFGTPEAITFVVYLQTGSGGFGVGGDGGSPYVLLPVIKLITGGGGFKMGGAGVVTTLSPDTMSTAGVGGWKFGGLEFSGDPHVIYPDIASQVGHGGFKMSGGGRWLLPNPGDIPISTITARGGFQFGGSGTFTNTLPPQLLVVGDGGFLFGGFRTDRPTVSYLDLYTEVGTPVVFAFGGQGVWLLPKASTLLVTPSKGVFGFGGAGVVSVQYPPVFLVLPTGGFCLSGTGLEAPGTDTWVLTGNSFEPSLYTNYAFESYARMGNQYFGIKEDGIYLLAGADDDGVKIIPAVRIGPLNLGNSNFKRLRAINVGDHIPDAPESRVRVEAITKEGLPNMEGQVGVEGGRFSVPYNLQARSFIIDVAGFHKLSHLEITAMTLIWD